ncbi:MULTISPECIES: hypothetical protein [unclassified Roseovarius]|uniref:hypothetical protein n=1 Tax=unclassified Roseovarius TaxID=2614913 RepID=UPI00273E86D8|nr:hypothetical protein [Roseovarius sp. MMSF_3350]
MDRLSFYITFFTGSFITGVIVIAGFSLGYYTVWTIAIAAVAGLLLAWPTGYMISQRIKRDDPDWTPEADPGDQPVIPRPDAPEV